MSFPYFPNISPKTLELELRLRRIASSLGEAEILQLYEIFSQAADELVSTNLSVHEDFVVAEQAGRSLSFPRPVPLVILAHITCGYEDWLMRKYSLPGFVEVESGDIVIDCGAYVGGFSLSASKRAAQLHAFEPEKQNYEAIKKNISDIEGVTVLRAGLYDVTTEMKLNVSESSVEHSLLLPDAGQVIATEKVKVWSLSDYCSAAGLNELDFVKVEAEGVEPEVLLGLGSIRPRKLAIDVSEERNGASPINEILPLLDDWGYEIRQRNHVLFARRARG